MVRKCCVPLCRSNYNKDDKISTFKFPDDERQRNLWIRKINRENFIPTKYSAICIIHFEEKFISRTIDHKTEEGEILSVSRKFPQLRSEAFPSIFPNLPSYLSTSLSKERKHPYDREMEIKAREKKKEEAQELAVEIADSISSFNDFTDDIKHHVPGKFEK